jgi:hypothetical protein
VENFEMWEARADLHTHSTCSDGDSTPEEIVSEADIAGLSWLALTDHDAIDGIARAQSEITRRGLPLQLISGVELSAYCEREDLDLHILAYGFDPEDADVCRYMADFRDERWSRLDRMLTILAEHGMPIAREDVLKLCTGESVGRLHIAHAMMRCGYVSSPDEAFQKYLRRGCTAYVPRKKYQTEQIIELVHSWSAIAVLAHPNYFEERDLSEAELEAMLERYIALGLDGLECWHSKVSKKLRRVLKRLALRHGLVVTGGSDSHGSRDNRPRVGDCSVNAQAMEAFLARLGGTP